MNVRDLRLEFLAKLHFARFDSPRAVADLIAGQLSVCCSSQKSLKNKEGTVQDRDRVCSAGFPPGNVRGQRGVAVETVVPWPHST